MISLFQKNYPHKILLASTSPYRKEQLKTLGYTFKCDAPLTDEEKYKNNSLTPKKLSSKLAKLKANSLKEKYPDYLIIGADQICHQGLTTFSKPVTLQNAKKQLLTLQNAKHTLTTAISIFFKGKDYLAVNETHLFMRPLSSKEISDYLKLDDPLYCAGSYKFESLGHKLFQKIETNDPSAIIGLPLLSLQTLLLQLANEA